MTACIGVAGCGPIAERDHPPAHAESVVAQVTPIAIARFTGRNAVDLGMIVAGGVLASLPPWRSRSCSSGT